MKLPALLLVGSLAANLALVGVGLSRSRTPSDAARASATARLRTSATVALH